VFAIGKVIAQTQQTVVRDEEEQYSVWPLGRDLPPGWIDAGLKKSHL
jgi:uncharacterized protein YbdZ (MbtH family)